MPGRVGLAESRDGVTWISVDGDEYQGAVLNPNEGEWWGFDTTHCGVGDVQSINTDRVRGSDGNQGAVQFMYLFGGDGEEVEVGGLEMGGKVVPQGTKITGLRIALIGLFLFMDFNFFFPLKVVHGGKSRSFACALVCVDYHLIVVVH